MLGYVLIAMAAFTAGMIYENKLEEKRQIRARRRRLAAKKRQTAKRLHESSKECLFWATMEADVPK